MPRATKGTVGRAVGLTLLRYRVAWDNDVAMTSVLERNFVPESEWRQFRIDEKRAAEAAKAIEEVEAAEITEPAPADADPPAESAGDDRMAALLAKSKAARAAKQG